jgi:hypothetical protein
LNPSTHSRPAAHHPTILPLDEHTLEQAAIVKMLTERTAAKAGKDYAKADSLAKELQVQNICYIDEKKEWYTRAPPKQKGEKRSLDEDDDEEEEAGGVTMGKGIHRDRAASSNEVVKKVKTDGGEKKEKKQSKKKSVKRGGT